MVEVKCMTCGKRFEIDVDLQELEKKYQEVEFHCPECNDGWIGIYLKQVNEMSEEEFEAETWECTKKKYNLTPCLNCEDIKKDALKMKGHRCLFCMFYWRG